MANRNFSFNRLVSDVITQAIAEAIGSTASSLTALQTKQLVLQVDLINKTFVNAAHTRHHFGGWSWMEALPSNFQTKNSTTLSVACAASAVTVTLTSSASFPSTGRLWIKTTKGAVDFFDYTANNTSTGVLTGVTGLDIAHSSGEMVEQLYVLPTDFAKTRHLLVDEQEYIYDQKIRLPYGGTFDYAGDYIVLPQNIGTHDASLLYEKKPATLNSSTASVDNSGTDQTLTLDIPDDFFQWPVEMLKSYIFRTRRMNDKAIECRVIANGPDFDRTGEAGGLLAEYLAYDCSQTTSNLINPPW